MGRFELCFFIGLMIHASDPALEHHITLRVTAAALILKEAVTWNIVLGVILIICGSLINLTGHRNQPVISQKTAAVSRKTAAGNTTTTL